ncbi:putative glycosyltransferase [Candidatus Desulfarcum epimagneticum]|uniref:Putative glycosyltransferase n=1 Tax=uncultured Desulfobacteraceae bacterium TaxID=218296 RepID=A0A484HCM9_9BACT|nr:putative glycosyltransferase [uncultured Desulfobacteraceae bacterium]
MKPDDAKSDKDAREEIAALKKTVEERDREIAMLAEWMGAVRVDVGSVFSSFAWKIGNALIKIMAGAMGFPYREGLRERLEGVFDSFRAWRASRSKFSRDAGSPSRVFDPDSVLYGRWIQKYDILEDSAISRIRDLARNRPRGPVFSLLMHSKTAGPDQWADSLESVLAQIWPNWEVLSVCGEAGDPTVDTYAARDSRIKKISCSHHSGAARALSRLVSDAKGDFITVLTPGDEWSPDALGRVAEALEQRPGIRLIYTDHDRINGDRMDGDRRRHSPCFKPSWNPDLLASVDFIGPSAFYHRESAVALGGFSPGFSRARGYDLTWRFIEKFGWDALCHIPRPLFHQKSADGDLVRGMRKALEGHFRRLKKNVQVVDVPGGLRTIYPLPSHPPLVSLIIPIRDRADLLRTALDGLLGRTDYEPVEIIVMDNGSRDPETLAYLSEIKKDSRISVIRRPGPFNYSRLNNIGAARAAGEIIGFVNNDIEVISPGWLKEMAGHALRPEIGAVGAMLRYGDGSVQHAGVVMGLRGLADHAFRFMDKGAPNAHPRLGLIQNYSAVTAACMVMRRRVFEKAGGFNEKSLKVTFNDVDLCLRLEKMGHRILWTPFAELSHHESSTRGPDHHPKRALRLAREIRFMKSKWKKTIENDPCYSPNLTRDGYDFAPGPPVGRKSTQPTR